MPVNSAAYIAPVHSAAYIAPVYNVGLLSRWGTRIKPVRSDIRKSIIVIEITKFSKRHIKVMSCIGAVGHRLAHECWVTLEGFMSREVKWSESSYSFSLLTRGVIVARTWSPICCRCHYLFQVSLPFTGNITFHRVVNLVWKLGVLGPGLKLGSRGPNSSTDGGMLHRIEGIILGIFIQL